MKQFSKLKPELMKLSLPIGVLVVTAYPEYNIIYANERFRKMLGYTEDDVSFVAGHRSAWSCIYAEDIVRLKAEAALRNGDPEPYDVAYRVVKKDGSLIWVNQCSQHMVDDGGDELVYAYYTDITAQKQTEHALRESESRYAAAVRSANINIWEYDYAADTMTIFSKSPKVHPKDNIVTNYTKTAIEEGHISTESAPLLLGMIERLKNGAAEVTADLWIRQDPTDEFWCERVIYTNSFDENGTPVKAYCVGRDITKEKEAEKRYHDELSYREAMQKATMASINVNLTKNIILDYKSIFPEVTAHMESAQTAQGYFDQVSHELASPKMQQQWVTVFHRDALLRQFASGQTTLSMELTRKIGGRQYWTIITAHMMKKENGDVVAFLYSTDVTGERTMQHIMNAIATTDYDFLVVADVPRNTSVRYTQKTTGGTYVYESDHFVEESRDYVRRYVCPEDVPRVLREIELKTVLAQLDIAPVYNVFYGIPNPDGGVFKKQLRFSYINRELKSMLMARVDITAAVMAQERKNQELQEAVQMAERANAAKSDFLSRISHEIRTPMNAIMGMDQLAAQRLDDPAFVGECIAKSQYASRYLLQLLGDILDMSSIESGKVSLKTELIACPPFLDAISTIVETQAKAKGVRYVVTKFEGCKYSYLGDGVRLQQILINILTNAVKFTDPGGTVCLDIDQVGGDEKTALIRFTIRDTGIGISPAFLPDLFKPFAQEHNGTRSGYGGSGLGLAISSNLVELMGGTLTVESVVGQGTTFQAEIPFGIPDANAASRAESTAAQRQTHCDFTGKCFLLVEDHQLNIMVARKLLEFKNATVEVAENGQIGLRMFAAHPEHYDAVLMDIRMPVMDGLECATAIRNLENPRAQKVPIVAMSANAFDEDVVKSKSAGMNAHLAKPIEASLLYETLQELLEARFEKGEKRHV